VEKYILEGQIPIPECEFINVRRMEIFGLSRFFILMKTDMLLFGFKDQEQFQLIITTFNTRMEPYIYL